MPKSDPKKPTTMPASTGTKRLTLDIPEALHRKIKAACALKGAKMVDEIRSLLEERFGKV